MAEPAEASSVFIDALVPILGELMAKDPEDYTYAIRNAEDCWYPPTCAVMTDLIPRLTNKDIEYSKDTAIADAQGTVNNVFEQFKDEALVQVYYPQCIANGYNSTTMQLLANNAYAKTVSEGAKVVLDNIQRYAGIRVSDLQVMSQLIGAIRNSKTVGDIYKGQIQDFSWVSSTAELITSIFNNNVNPNTKPAV